MKIIKYIIFSSILGLVFLSSCSQNYEPGKDIKIVQEDTINVPEIEALLRFLGNSGEYVNSMEMPSLVNAQDVNDNLGKYFIIDIRTKDEYVNGHISGAVNLGMSEILEYLNEKVAPSVYDKLVIVCSNGQSSAYTAGVLRLTGYNNAYSMSYGMSSWNASLDQWSSKLSSQYTSKLESKTNPVEGMHAYPAISTGQHCGAEILEARSWTLLNTPFQKLKISADRAFNNLNDFYIISYMDKAKYDIAHIPGSYNYVPHQDLSPRTLLNTIPSDKKILVYDYTGQTAAFVVAYLRLLGYNAFTLPFGANSFMYNTMVTNNWVAFKKADKVNDFELIKGENPTDKSFEKEMRNTKKKAPAPKKPVGGNKKKEVSGGCS